MKKNSNPVCINISTHTVGTCLMCEWLKDEWRLIFAHMSPFDLSLCSKLPSWARAVVPKIFYVTEKAWNYYPYTITGRRSDTFIYQHKRLFN